MRRHKDVLRDALKDPEVKKEYERLGPEYERRRQHILARKEQDEHRRNAKDV